MNSENQLLHQINSIYDDVETLMEEMEDVLERTNDTGWTVLTLNEGWSNQYEGAIAKYRKIGKVVYLRGLVSATASAGTIIGTLPAGYRPIGQFHRFACALGQSNTVNIEITNVGNVLDYTKGSSQSRDYISLYGIAFTVN